LPIRASQQRVSATCRTVQRVYSSRRSG
jgi:hypothetical protein